MDSWQVRRHVLGFGLGIFLAAAPTRAVGDPLPVQVTDAESLVADLSQSHKNTYGSAPSYILWQGVNSEARTVGSTFVTLLLQHSYGWTPATFSTWLGTPSPDAATYHDAIVALNHFSRIDDIGHVQPGDLMAIKYLDGPASSGQVLIVLDVPKERTATSPVVPGLTQYEVAIVDSSSSPHGPTDTRVTPPLAAGQGIGRGAIRVYVNASGQPVGYSWSTLAGSHYYTQAERNLVIGRLLFPIPL